jgi:hypothetical protein
MLATLAQIPRESSRNSAAFITQPVQLRLQHSKFGMYSVMDGENIIPVSSWLRVHTLGTPRSISVETMVAETLTFLAKLPAQRRILRLMTETCVINRVNTVNTEPEMII